MISLMSLLMPRLYAPEGQGLYLLYSRQQPSYQHSTWQ